MHRGHLSIIQITWTKSTIGPFSLGLKTRKVRKITKLGWKLPSNCTTFHPKLRTKNRKSECDFSNFVRNFARCFVMRTHTAEISLFYSRDFRICSSSSTRHLNVRAAVSEFRIQYSCTYYTGNGWTSKPGMRSSSRNFAIFSSELTSWVFGVMRIRSVKHREFSCHNFL